MKSTIRIGTILIGSLLLFAGAGCKKGASSEKPQTAQEGVQQLRQVLINANADVQSNLYSGVIYAMRYGRSMDALMALDRIVTDPSLNDQQRKAVSNVIDLVKQEVQGQEGAPKPAQ